VEIQVHTTSSGPGEYRDSGFSLPELLISLLVLSVIVGTVTQMSMQMSNSQRTMWNRTQMHSSVRGAIALLQQEVGQAGLITLPAPVTFTGTVTAFSTTVASVTSSAGMFYGEKLVVGTGATQETVEVAAVGSNTFTSVFTRSHDVGEPVRVLGGFAQGIIPPAVSNGSTATVLKMFGDINDDGQMVYVEYTCSTATGKLSRNMMPITATSKPALTASNVLVSNVVANPGGAPCFSYQTEFVSPHAFVTAIAVTLSVQTQDIDPVTRAFQIETKTLLNVSPRNVFSTWQLASTGDMARVQVMPLSIQVLVQ
jgi:prepilin-type N-terminal cleavage/methylation domain-containing protein